MRRSAHPFALALLLAGGFVVSCAAPEDVASRPASETEKKPDAPATPPPGTEELWIIERFDSSDESADLTNISHKRRASAGSELDPAGKAEQSASSEDSFSPLDLNAGGLSELRRLITKALPRDNTYRGPGDTAPPRNKKSAAGSTNFGMSSFEDDDGDGIPDTRRPSSGDTRGYIDTDGDGIPDSRSEDKARLEEALIARQLHLANITRTGGMIATGEHTIPIPLEHTDVLAKITSTVASVHVRQAFSNPYDQKIEAVYVFPLPHDAAVHEFVMTVGDRTIRGILREREEAQRLYADAKRQGKTASLLTQERPNVFTQKVANIEPQKSIDVEIEYFHTLPYKDGWYELAFPMVVGPRYNPPGSTGGVGATPRTQPNASGQTTNVAYLAPNERSGHDIALRVELDAGTTIEALECDTHEVSTNYADARPGEDGATRCSIELAPTDRIPNRDFVLRWRVAGRELKTAWLASGDSEKGTFSLTLHPPLDASELPRRPIEMICVVDTSGSMRGQPMTIAKSALHRILDALEPSDAFQILRFSNDVSSLGPDLVAASADNVARGHDYVDKLDSGGGTQMIRGIRAALQYERDPLRQTVIAFLTDGYIGNEEEILGEVHQHIDDARIFSFGIGTSVNRFLLERLATEGRGTVAYVGLDARGGEIMESAFQRMCRPALSDVALDFGGLEVADVYPKQLPDLFPGRSVVVTGRYVNPARAERTQVRLSGRLGGRLSERTIAADLVTPADTDRSSLDRLWARARIADLTSEVRGLRDAFEREACFDKIRATALEHGLMSAFTAFVAVDSLSQTEGGEGVSVQVPVPVPAGVRYETTVGG